MHRGFIVPCATSCSFWWDSPPWAELDDFSPSPEDTLAFDFLVATCGDGVAEGAEGCDDGNQAPGDGCTPSCITEPGFTCTGSPSVCSVPPPATCADPIVVDSMSFAYSGSNLTAFGNDAHYSADCLQSPIGQTGDMVFRIDATVNEKIRYQNLGTGPATLHTFPQGACGTGCGLQVGGATPGALTALASGPIYLALEGYSSSQIPTSPEQTFDIRIDRSLCGNGIIEWAESCDDGNLNPNDGCVAACFASLGWVCEGEPSVCRSVENCGDDLTCYLGACPGGTIVQGSAAGLPIGVPDDTTEGALIDLAISQSGTIRSMAMRFRATHPEPNDLRLLLARDGQANWHKVSMNNGTGTDYGNATHSVFFVDGATPIEIYSGQLNRAFSPTEPFSNFAGQSTSGTWSLRVADTDDNNWVGEVTAFDLAFCVDP